MSLVLHFLLLGPLCWFAAGLWLNEKTFLVSWKRPDPAEALNRWLQHWQLATGNGAGLAALAEVPQFKFFGRLAEAGLRHARSFGTFPRELLWEWRDGLAKERAFDLRWRGITHAAWAQFALFILITWVFVAITADTLSGPLPVTLYAAMGGLQLAGLTLFRPLLRILAHRRLRGFPELLEGLYVLRSLSGAGLPTGQVLSEAKLERLPAIVGPFLKPLVQRVSELASLYQKQGGALGREAQILLQETWFLREEALQKLVKLGEGLKLIFLLVFFAGSYFLFLIGLVFQLLKSS
jgi:hypothetical protein